MIDLRHLCELIVHQMYTLSSAERREYLEMVVILSASAFREEATEREVAELLYRVADAFTGGEGS